MKPRKTWELLIIFAAFALFVSACGNDEGPEPESPQDTHTTPPVSETDLPDEYYEDDAYPFEPPHPTYTLGFSEEEVEAMSGSAFNIYMEALRSLERAAFDSEHQHPDVYYGEVDAPREVIDEMDEQEWARNPLGLIAVTHVNREGDKLELGITFRYINPHHVFRRPHSSTDLRVLVYDDHGNEYETRTGRPPEFLYTDEGNTPPGRTPVGYTKVTFVEVEVPEMAPLEKMQITLDGPPLIDWPIDEDTGLPRTVDVGTPDEWAEKFYGDFAVRHGETSTIDEFIELTLVNTYRFSFIDSDRVFPVIEYSAKNTDYNQRDVDIDRIHIQLRNGELIQAHIQHSSLHGDADYCKIESNPNWRNCEYRNWRRDAQLTLEHNEEESAANVLRIRSETVGTTARPPIYEPADMVGVWITFDSGERIWVPLDLSEEFQP